MKTKTQDGYWPLMITLGVILFATLLLKFTGVNLLQELAKVFANQLTEIFSVGAWRWQAPKRK